MIESYSFGQVTIDGREYTADVIIYSDHVDDTWWRAEGHRCCLADLPGVWRHHPAALVIGTGDPGLMRVDDDLKEYCAGNAIELIVLPTAQAVDAFNQRRSNTITVIAALHLTC
jgi:hypothetical protein